MSATGAIADNRAQRLLGLREGFPNVGVIKADVLLCEGINQALIHSAPVIR
jgi:hypothetical protein